MNLLFIHADDGSLMRSLPRIHFLNELERAKHIISVFNPLHYEDISIANEELIKHIKGNPSKFDLIVCLNGDETVYVETIKQINKEGIPSLLICFDNLQVPYMHKEISPFFDLVWLTSFETMHMFQKWGCNCIFLPYAANPYAFKPSFNKEICSIGFIGSPYGTRIHKINKLLTSDIKCNIYSSKITSESTTINDQKIVRKSLFVKLSEMDYKLLRFPIGRKILLSKLKVKFSSQPRTLTSSPYLKIFPSVSFDEMNSLYSNFALSLGITELWDTYILKHPIHKLHMRTFEIPMCGGLQFAPYIEELSDYFTDGKEIVLYKDEEEYIDKAKYYLKDDMNDLRLKMKMSARERAEKEHTWLNRFNKIFDLLKLNQT